jgi:hypothetical protein
MWLNLKGIRGDSDSNLILRTIGLWLKIAPSPIDEFNEIIDDKKYS